MSHTQAVGRTDTGLLTGQGSGRSAAIGATVLASCWCSIDKIMLGAGGVGMLGTRFGANLYSGVFLGALALILVGLARRSAAARVPVAAGVTLLAGGLLLSPPSSMHYTTPTLTEVGGFVLMLGGAAAVVWAFLRAFPTRRPGAAACAAGGFGAAAGCACCVSSGAVAGFAVALGATIPAAPWQDGIFYAAFIAFAVAGLYRLAGPRWALLALTGAVIAFGGDEALKPLLPDQYELLPRLAITLAGTGVIMWAFTGAFGRMARGEPVLRTGGSPQDPRTAGTATA